ncbi:MAG: hypothetical protein HRT41_01080 [Campylobacteraceae bacterium]|nr:hypothetical protein [Campylobacteraceae bacterium]
MIDLTSSTLYRLDNLNKAQIQLSYQQSTGKLIDRGSDDTQIFASEIYVQDKITVYEGITFQVEKTAAQNSNADSALASMKTLLEYVKAELLKALNDTNGATERSTIAVQLEGVKENMIMLANERIEGEYLFAGSNTTVKPFSQDPSTGKITYEGDGYLREVAVEYGSYRDKGVTGFDMMSMATSTILDNNDSSRTYPVQQSVEEFDENSKIIFKTGTDKILDSKGNEWKFYDANADGTIDSTEDKRLYKFDSLGKTDDYLNVAPTSNANEYTTISDLGYIDVVNTDLGDVKSLITPSFFKVNTTFTSSEITFTYGEERIVDSNGNEWKFLDDNQNGTIDSNEKDKIYKFDHNGKTDEYLTVTATSNSNEYITSTLDNSFLDSGDKKTLINQTFFTNKLIYEKDSDLPLSTNSEFVFTDNEGRIIDQDGNEWRFHDVNNDGVIAESEKNKLYKYDINGKTQEYYNTVSTDNANEFKISSSLTEVSLDSGSTRTVTTPSFSLYTPASATSSQILFKEGEGRIIDQDGNEWKFYDENGNGEIGDDEKNKLYKFDSNGKTQEYYSVLKTGNAGEFITTDIGTVNLDSGGTKELINPSFEVKKNIFDVLDDIIEGLKNNDVEQMRTGLDEITKSYDAVNQAHADLGARNKVFELSLERLSTKLTQFKIFYSEVSSADPAKIAIEAKALELTYVSLYSTINRLNSMSLVNYLN